MRYRRPPCPAGFADAVAPHAERIRDQLAADGKADFKGRDVWRHFKAELASGTFGKCGYCEVNVVVGDRYKGDVEHYRPKSRVDRMVVGPDGTVRLQPLFATGYHWLAYDWTNYILTCSHCNSLHKRTFFPLWSEPAEAPTAGSTAAERPLLLDPFGRRDPAKHLTFDRLGVIGPRNRSRYGAATIAVCGLSRTPLEKKRSIVARALLRHIDVLANPAAHPETIDLALGAIADLGHEEADHSGMVRAMFTQATDLPWSYVEQSAPPAEP